METEMDPPTFNASTESGFTDSGAWVISPRLWYHEDLSTGKRVAMRPEAREQLVSRVLEEAIRGSRLGAERIQIALENGKRVTVAGPPDEPEEASPPDLTSLL
jgi:hypothetical protein